jgi:trigger factor
MLAMGRRRANRDESVAPIAGLVAIRELCPALALTLAGLGPDDGRTRDECGDAAEDTADEVAGDESDDAPDAEVDTAVAVEAVEGATEDSGDVAKA